MSAFRVAGAMSYGFYLPRHFGMVIPGSIRNSPTLVRVVPFAVFVVLTFCQDLFGGAGRYWFYLAKTLVGAWMACEMWMVVPEMHWRVSWEGVAAGVLVFVVWVGLDALLNAFGAGYPKLMSKGEPWNPHIQFGTGSMLAWLFIVVRIAGSALVVPPLEEVFFRSWLYRYIANPDFKAVPLGKFLWMPFVVSSIIFGLEHREWVAGILAGFAYAGLVCWKKRLGDAIVAHGITNFVLGLWVVVKGQWQYW
jgi:CAAX prenyl protease-like protein